jgi:hypothetical protein
MVAVSELVSGLDAELVRLGYKASTMVVSGLLAPPGEVLRIPWGAGILAGSGDGMGRPGLRRVFRQGAGRHAQTDRARIMRSARPPPPAPTSGNPRALRITSAAHKAHYAKLRITTLAVTPPASAVSRSLIRWFVWGSTAVDECGRTGVGVLWWSRPP